MRLFAIIVILFGCVNSESQPIENTTKLVKRGHGDLYRQGALKIPKTPIYLIPPVENTFDFALELAGVRARQSFRLAIKKAQDGVVVVADGSKYSYKLFKIGQKEASELNKKIRDLSREGSKVLAVGGYVNGKKIVGDSWDKASGLMQQNELISDEIIEASWTLGDKLEKDQEKNASAKLARRKQRNNAAKAQSEPLFQQATSTFVLGYMALPDVLSKNLDDVTEAAKDVNPINIIEKEKLWHDKFSHYFVDLFSSSYKSYGEDLKKVRNQANKDIETGKDESGIPLAVFKSLRWLLQGIFWDMTIKPIGKATVGALGYVGVKVLYPVMVVGKGMAATTMLAVSVGWNSGESMIEIVAPTGKAAVAGAFSVVKYGSENIARTAANAGDYTAAHLSVGMGKVSSVLVKGGGYTAGKITQYVGVPLTAAGIAVAGTLVGTTIATAGAGASAPVFVGGEVAGYSTEFFGNILSGTGLAAGVTVSTAVGGGYSLYQLSKAIVVPAGYQLGSGVILSYEAAAQLGAHSILAVSDAAYLVLSLEVTDAPRWVVYAVQGKLNDGDNLAVGTILDLKAMQKKGEEIRYLPISDKEMEGVVEKTYENLPKVKEVRKK